MRPRDRDIPVGAGAEHGLAHGLVGTGDALRHPPATLTDAVAATTHLHGERAGRRLSRFAALPDGTFVWTRDRDGRYRVGRIAGPWRYDDSAAARAVGIHHVRPVTWHEHPFDTDEVPQAVTATFARGGRNLQRTRKTDAERRTAELWAHATDGE